MRERGRIDERNHNEGAMSVRAYRVKKIECEETPSVNLWFDKALANRLGFYDGEKAGLDQDGYGFIYVEAAEVRRALRELKSIDPEQRKTLKADVAAARAAKHDYILYQCF